MGDLLLLLVVPGRIAPVRSGTALAALLPALLPPAGVALGPFAALGGRTPGERPSRKTLLLIILALPRKTPGVKRSYPG